MKAEGKRLLNMECMVPSGPRYERGITLSNEERAAAMEDCLLQTERQADELIDGETEQVWGNQAKAAQVELVHEDETFTTSTSYKQPAMSFS
jgi:hypothetical protein